MKPTLAPFALALAAACAAPEPPVESPLWSVLGEADSWTILRIDPSPMDLYEVDGEAPPSDAAFHGYPELARTELADPDALRELLTGLEAGIAGNDSMVAACFNPRHGVIAESGGRRIDLLICFECLQIQVFDGEGENVEDALTTEAPAAVFNRVFTAAGI